MIRCHRCGKEMADRDEEARMLAAQAVIDYGHKDEIEIARTAQENFRKKYCTCPLYFDSQFTSSPQPPNLDDIERRLK